VKGWSRLGDHGVVDQEGILGWIAGRLSWLLWQLASVGLSNTVFGCWLACRWPWILRYIYLCTPEDTSWLCCWLAAAQ
jgi:hypothetical protein